MNGKYCKLQMVEHTHRRRSWLLDSCKKWGSEYLAVYFCRFVIFLVLRFEDKKWSKINTPRVQISLFLLVKGLVDDSKKWIFWSFLWLDSRLEFIKMTVQCREVEKKISHLQFVSCNPGRKFQHNLMKSCSMPEECVCKADENLMGTLPGRL